MNTNSGRARDDARGQGPRHPEACERVLASFSIASTLQHHALKIFFIRLGKRLMCGPLVRDAAFQPA